MQVHVVVARRGPGATWATEPGARPGRLPELHEFVEPLASAPAPLMALRYRRAESIVISTGALWTAARICGSPPA